MADVFNEVDEEFRAARYAQFARRAWPYALAVLAAALLVALAAWAWDQHLRSQDARASQDYAKGLAALAAKDEAGAGKSFDTAAREGRGAYRALALMQQAGLRLRAAKPAEAVDLLDRAAAAERDPALHDAAALEAAFLSMNTAPLAQTTSRLDPLIARGRPYRSMAREALAMAKIAAGRGAEAKGDLQVLALQQDVSDVARARARAAIAMINSGAAAAVPAVVKAQAAQPPAPFAPPIAGPGPAGGPGQ